MSGFNKVLDARSVYRNLFLHISKEFENELTNIINSTIKKYDTLRNKFDMYVKNYKTLLKESKPK